MKQRKKNKLLTLFFSLIPGAGEMYMGFMKMGFSIMSIFTISIILPILFDIEIFLCISILIWFFAFFHARNLATCDNETFFALEDDWIFANFIDKEQVPSFGKSYQKGVAIILIIFGFGSLLNNCMNLIYNLIPNVLWDVLYPIANRMPKILISIVLIIVGVKMIQGKKEQIDGKGE